MPPKSVPRLANAGHPARSTRSTAARASSSASHTHKPSPGVSSSSSYRKDDSMLKSSSSSSSASSPARDPIASPKPNSPESSPHSSSNLEQLPRSNAKEYLPGTYPTTRTEKRVFNTPPYSGYIKQYWRFKDLEAARESCERIWGVFRRYADVGDFVGMDTCRKFIQMGRTRSLRYALRPGGRKYTYDSTKDTSNDGKDGKSGGTGRREMKRTGKIYDQGKYDGAMLFKRYEGKCWRDGGYRAGWERFGGREVEVEDGGESEGERQKGEEKEERAEGKTVKASKGDRASTGTRRKRGETGRSALKQDDDESALNEVKQQEGEAEVKEEVEAKQEEKGQAELKLSSLNRGAETTTRSRKRKV